MELLTSNMGIKSVHELLDYGTAVRREAPIKKNAFISELYLLGSIKGITVKKAFKKQVPHELTGITSFPDYTEVVIHSGFYEFRVITNPLRYFLPGSHSGEWAKLVDRETLVYITGLMCSSWVSFILGTKENKERFSLLPLGLNVGLHEIIRSGKSDSDFYSYLVINNAQQNTDTIVELLSSIPFTPITLPYLFTND